MHPEIERQMATQRVEELRRAGAVARLRNATPPPFRETEVVIRLARPQDALAVEALAVLADAPSPRGGWARRASAGGVCGAPARRPLGAPRRRRRGAAGARCRRPPALVSLLEARAQ